MSEHQSESLEQPSGSPEQVSGSPEASSEKPRPQRPTVVGIGASAGGLQALKEFFRAVPRDSGLAYVVVVHLASDRESQLANLLQPHTPVPVAQVTETTLLEPNHVYVIPPDHNLSAIDSHLRLTPLEERSRRAPVDYFFNTLAESFDGQAVAVILSGTGGDGAHGVRRIRERGGIVVAQDPTQAEFDGMPRSAIDTGAVDIVLPVAEIPRRILELDGTRPRVRITEEPPSGGNGEQALVPRILTQVRVRTGHDFSRYKRSTIERRVERRMQLNGVEKPEEYLEVLRNNPQETAALAEDLLINVTAFFRDRAVFEYLERNVIPSLFEGKSTTNRVRVWSVGCATGEEAYSIGMLLIEEASRREHPPQIQIFASDLHERSLHFAREGLYPDTIATDVSAERLARFFQRENGGYRVRKELRERVVFAPHNLLRDPPFSHLDMIACRNMLIYLQREVQSEVQELFHYALHGEGRLLLGTAEMVDRSDLFVTESKEHHLYRRRAVARADTRVPSFPLPSTVAARHTPAVAAPPNESVAGQGALHQQMVERYAPPSLLIDAGHNVLHVSEHAGRYLQVPGGLPSTTVFRLVREELRTELRAALLLARERRTTSQSKPIPLRIDGETRHVVLRVSPAGVQEMEGLTLVIFDEVPEAPPEAVPPAPATDAAAVRELESELEMTRGRLQALVEEFESSQEEMRASNEELQSANEELRSTMEELETSREELQSINEELQTLNQENQHKVEELSQLSSDLQNLLKVTDIATLFLDRALRINRFTPRVGELFNVRNSDRGRPLADLTHRLGYGGLLEDARKVLETLVPVEREVKTEDGRWFLIRVVPYRTVDERIEGVVITLVDVTTFKLNEAALRASEEKYRTLFERMDEAYAVVDVIPDETGRWSDVRFVEVNPAFIRHTGMPNPVGRTATELLGTPAPRWVEHYGHVVDTGDALRVEETEPTLGRTFDLNIFRLGDAANRRAAAVFSDVTERKRAETSLRESEARFREVAAHRTAERDALRWKLLEAEEAERRRLARELHDEVGQRLTALGLGLQALSDAVAAGSEADRRAVQLRAVADTLARELHSLAVRLRPKALDDFGLEAALAALAEEWSEQSGVAVDVHAAVATQRLPPAVENAVYRIVQEALTNVARHSGAKRASVVVERRDGHVVAIVEDDGRGFDVSAASRSMDGSGSDGKAPLGLLGMRERAALLGGSVEIESTLGKGTAVFARIPTELPSTYAGVAPVDGAR